MTLATLLLSLVQGSSAPLISTGAVWRYLDNGSDQGTAWRDAAFDDSSWAAGPAQLGYGDGDEASVVSYGTNANNKYITTYFRRAFTVDDASAISNLTLRLLRDDGAVVFLNESELYRHNMPTGEVNYLTLAASNVTGTAESTFYQANVSRGALVTGTNILAVEIHQSATNSADISFDLELIADLPPTAPAVAITSPINDASFQTPISITLNATASDSDGAVMLVEFFAYDTKLAEDAASPYAFTWNNVPAGDYLLTAHATDDSGLVSTSAPVHIVVNLAGSALVAKGSSWKYLDDGSDQATAWREATFDDSRWAVGPAQLGYGDGDEVTVVSYGPDANNKFITTYFRHAFYVDDPSVYPALTLDLLRDDGAVVYLNGREVFRSNVPGGAINYRTLASSGVSGAAESTFYRTNVAATNLVAGTNLLAVEVHQNSATSSDISFDLQLTGPETARLARGPYLQIATTNSAIIRWRTDLPTDSVVTFGTDPTNLTSGVTNTALVTEHIVQLTGLEPQTKYFYSVGTTTNVLAGDTNHFFITPPPVGSVQPVRLWALGDPGTANQNARNVRDAYLRFTDYRPVDVWLMLGDNAYDSGLDSEYQAAVFDMYPMVLRNTFLWPTIGNHDSAQSHTASNFAYLEIFSLPTAGEAGGIASGTEKYYSFDYANIHFICLDAMTSDRTTDGPMLMWLQNDLAATLQQWIIAFWHHPPYSKGNHNSDTEIELVQMRQNALPILEAAGVDLVLCGHSHVYERSLFLHGHYGLSTTLTDDMKLDGGSGREEGTGAYLKAEGVGTNVGAVYVVAGSSGQTSDGPLNHPAMFFSRKVLGSTVVDINSNRLDLTFLDTNSVALDHFTLIKGPAQTTPPDTPTNFLATLIASTQIRLAWANNATNEVSFKLERSSDGTNFAQVAAIGANLTSYIDSGLALSTTYSYRIRASNFTGDSDYSVIASATTPTPPLITMQPQSLTVATDATAQFFVAATGTAPLNYQWRFNGTNLAGQTNVDLTINNAQFADAGDYTVRATNVAGQVTSAVATLTVVVPPTITAQPQDQLVNVGATASFSVKASGSEPLRYQWRLNQTNAISGATNGALTLVNVQEIDAGYYSVVIDNGVSVTSSNALLTVNHLPVPGAHVLERFARQGVKVRIADLLGTDPDGDALMLLNVNPASAEGGAVTANANWVFYTPPAGGTNADSFNYTVSDGRGGSATGTVTVKVKADVAATENLIVENLGNGSVRMRGAGIPARTYTVEFTEDLENPNWETLGTATADAVGEFVLVDTPPGGAAPRVYRATSN